MHREILNFHLENLEVGTVYRAKVLGLHLCPYAWRVFGDVGRVHSPWRVGEGLTEEMPVSLMFKVA